MNNHRKMKNMAIGVLLTNMCFPFSIGTGVYFCIFPNRETSDMIHGGLQFLFTVITNIVFYVQFANCVNDSVRTSNVCSNIDTFYIFAVLIVIAYFWGILFGGLLLCNVNRAPVPIMVPAGHHADVTMTTVTAVPMQQPPSQNYG